ncbi:MAG: hypothetical protein R2839_09605 [Thermomicrobiales bacterium]
MRPIVDPGKSPDRDELLGRLWDALQESGTLGSKEIDADDVAVITAIHNADDVAPADDDTIQRMWAAIDAGVTPQMPAGNARVDLSGHETSRHHHSHRRGHRVSCCRSGTIVYSPLRHGSSGRCR